VELKIPIGESYYKLRIDKTWITDDDLPTTVIDRKKFNVINVDGLHHVQDSVLSDKEIKLLYEGAIKYLQEKEKNSKTIGEEEEVSFADTPVATVWDMNQEIMKAKNAVQFEAAFQRHFLDLGNDILKNRKEVWVTKATALWKQINNNIDDLDATRDLKEIKTKLEKIDSIHKDSGHGNVWVEKTEAGVENFVRYAVQFFGENKEFWALSANARGIFLKAFLIQLKDKNTYDDEVIFLQDMHMPFPAEGKRMRGFHRHAIQFEICGQVLKLFRESPKGQNDAQDAQDEVDKKVRDAEIKQEKQEDLHKKIHHWRNHFVTKNLEDPEKNEMPKLLKRIAFTETYLKKLEKKFGKKLTKALYKQLDKNTDEFEEKVVETPKLEKPSISQTNNAMPPPSSTDYPYSAESGRSYGQCSDSVEEALYKQLDKNTDEVEEKETTSGVEESTEESVTLEESMKEADTPEESTDVAAILTTTLGTIMGGPMVGFGIWNWLKQGNSEKTAANTVRRLLGHKSASPTMRCLMEEIASRS